MVGIGAEGGVWKVRARSVVVIEAEGGVWKVRGRSVVGMREGYGRSEEGCGGDDGEVWKV